MGPGQALATISLRDPRGDPRPIGDRLRLDPELERVRVRLIAVVSPELLPVAVPIADEELEVLSDLEDRASRFVPLLES